MLKIIISTFITVFLAELGDKTQIQTMLLAAKTNRLLPVFIGSSLALMCSSLIGVFAGSIITKYIPPNYIQNASGVIFIILGVLILFGKI